MRIAIVAPPWLPVPPPAYGGTENTLDTLARGLQKAGHEVLLCTTGDSTCPVERTWVFEQSIGVGSGTSVDEIRHVTHAYGALKGVDVVHDHTLVGPLYSAAFPHLPVVTTNHGPFNEDLIDVYRAVAGRVPVIAISHHQASTAQDVPIAAVIHHGVDLDEYPVGAGGGGYALFLGRMHPGKAPHVAARIAREAGYPLLIAAKMREPEEHAYFDAKVRPLLGGDVTYRRRGRPRGQDRAPRRRGLPLEPDRLAGAVRHGHGRGAGLRHPRPHHAIRCGARDRRGRRRRLRPLRGGRPRAGARPPRPRSIGAPAGGTSRSASRQSGWWPSTSPCTGGRRRVIVAPLDVRVPGAA